jgi:CRP-like cAMP-binding protein
MIIGEDLPILKSKFNSLAPIPESEWNHLLSLLTPMKFKKGDHILHAGDETDSMYIITKGLTRSYYIDFNGKEFNKIFLAENDIASAYVELLNKIPSRLNIQALESTEVLVIKFKDVKALYERDHCWDRVGRKVAENFFVLKEQREYEFLLLDAESRYKNFLTDYSHIKDRIPQYQIAAYLGITPVSLSRVINSTKI